MNLGTDGLNGLNKSCILVIVVAGVERFAFKGVASNLVTYLTDVVKMSNSSAAKTVNSWCGVSFILPLFGAILADSYLDRYSTILASSFLYVVGLGALTSTALAWEWALASRTSTISSTSSLYSSILWCLFFISCGQGGYNPCLQAFGAEQLEIDNELPCSKDIVGNSSKKSSFFKWWYFGVSGDTLLGISLMPYIQERLGWGPGFAIPAIAMTMSVAPFFAGRRYYLRNHCKSQTAEKSIKNLMQSIRAVASKMKSHSIALPSKESEATELELQEKPLGNHDVDNTEMSLTTETDSISDKKSTLRLMPIWMLLLMFAVVFQQPATFFTKQGMTMKRNIGSNFKIHPATLQSAINVAIVLLLPFYDRAVVPIFRFITRDKKGMTVTQRIGIGMFLTILAMATAAVFETKRFEISRQTGVVPLSIFWLLPQYILLGASDVFTVVGMQEFFYSEVPNGMKTMGMSLHLSVFGVGSFLSALLISLIEFITSEGNGKHSWFSDDMKEARLNKFYWLLALLNALSLFVFVVLSRDFNKGNSHRNGNG